MRIPDSPRMMALVNTGEPIRLRLLGLGKKLWGNKWLRFGLRLGCTLLLFTMLLRSVSWSTMLVKLSKVDTGLLSIGMIIGLFGVIISSYQWQTLLHAEQIQVDLRKLVNLYLVGIAFNHFLPTGMGGDVVKVYYVGQESQNTTGSASAAIMSRFTGFLGMLLISLPTILIWHQRLKPELTTSFLLSCLALAGALCGVFVLVTMLPRLAHRWLRGKALTTVFKVGVTMRKSILRPHVLGHATFFGMVFHLSAALNFYCYARALGVNSVPVMFFLVAVPFVSLIAFLPISINGFGLREGVFVYIFSQLNMHHASPEVALVLILLIDVQVLLHGLVGGAIYLFMGMRKKQQVPASVKVKPGGNLSAQELSA